MLLPLIATIFSHAAGSRGAAAVGGPLAGSDGLDRGDDARPRRSTRATFGRRARRRPEAHVVALRGPALGGGVDRAGEARQDDEDGEDGDQQGSRERWNRCIARSLPRVWAVPELRPGRSGPTRMRRPSRRWRREGLGALPCDRRYSGTVGTALRSVSGPTVLARTAPAQDHPRQRARPARARARRRRAASPAARRLDGGDAAGRGEARARRARRSRAPRSAAALGRRRRRADGGRRRQRRAGGRLDRGLAVDGGSRSGVRCRGRLRGPRRHDRRREVGPEVLARRQARSLDARRERPGRRTGSATARSRSR